MRPGNMLVPAVLAACGLAASGLAELDDSAALFQRGRQLQYGSQDPDRTFLKDPAPEFRERDEFEGYKTVPNQKGLPARLAIKQKGKVLFSNPFKDMISNINLAIDSVKDGLESSTREVVHQAVAEMKDVGQQLSNELKQTMHTAIQKEINLANTAGEKASLLELAAGAAHKPKLVVNVSSEKAKKKKKTKIEFNPFKDLISGINQAIDVVKDGLESSTRDLVHQAAQELQATGKELTQELEQMHAEVMGTAALPPASLLDIGEVSAHKPKANLTVNSTKSKKKKQKMEFKKIEFNPFKDMISSINQVIDSVKTEVETSTHELIHDAAAEMRKAGEELSRDLQETARQAMEPELRVSAAAPVGA